MPQTWSKRVFSQILHQGTQIVMLASLSWFLTSPPLAAATRLSQKACTETAQAAFFACLNGARDDFWIARGNCFNIADAAERAACLHEAKQRRREAREECQDQREARVQICEMIGEAPYDPEIDPENFVHPSEIGKTVEPNPYFPLIAGSVWKYETKVGNEVIETITDTVTGETKEILGVTCVVVHNVVKEDGVVIEDTEDWYAQDKDGNIWYFGEIAQEFEEGELVSIEGSWKAGRDGAKPGIIMKARPEEGDVYRQEFALGEAEDTAEVLDTEASATVPAASCTASCVQTKDFTPLEPGVAERKYYAPDIGVILEENPETGERVELVEFHIGP